MANNRKHQVNEDFFTIIDSEAKAYILGLIYSDGYVTKKSQGFSSNDIELINIVANEMESTYPIRTYQKDRHNPTYELRFSSVKLRNTLIALGRGYCKTDSTWPILPAHLIHHFIRGMFDGDGGVRQTKNGLRASLSIAAPPIAEHIHKLLTFSKLPGKNGANLRFYFDGTGVCFKLRKYLYADATLYLCRKKETLFSCVPKYLKRFPELCDDIALALFDADWPTLRNKP